jgi:alkanesulfonate monooxygenase SsuD/methylene tetrahydromethanopterin reductase-like flavin-dependent oxidoreductase (luciferase family)
VRLLAWNIRQGGGSRLAGIVAALVRHDADVLVLSEYRGGDSADRLRAALALARYRHVTELVPPPQCTGVLIAARRGFSAHGALRMDVPEPYRLVDAFMRPKPVNRSVPIIIGGHTEAAARRAGRLGDGFFPGRGLPIELIEVVRRSAREAGRDPASVEVTVGMPDDLAQLADLAAAGVSRVLIPVTGVAGLQRKVSGPEDLLGWRDAIDRYAAL